MSTHERETEYRLPSNEEMRLIIENAHALRARVIAETAHSAMRRVAAIFRGDRTGGANPDEWTHGAEPGARRTAS